MNAERNPNSVEEVYRSMKPGELMKQCLGSEEIASIVRTIRFEVKALGIRNNMILLEIGDHPKELIPFRRYSSPAQKRDQLDFLSRLFRHPITDMETGQLSLVRNFNWIKHRQPAIENFTIYSGRISTTDAQYIIDFVFQGGLNVTKKMTVDMETDGTINSHFFLNYSRQPSNLTLHFVNGQWLHYMNLMFLVYRCVVIENSEMEDWELNYVLEDWKTEALGHLERLTIQTNAKMDQEEVVEKLDAVKLGDDYVQVIEKHNIEVTGGYNLMREDGQMATVTFTETNNGTTFDLYVW